MLKPTVQSWALPSCSSLSKLFFRSISSKQWQARQGKDTYTKEAGMQGLKSRAAFKLLQINDRYRLFKSGQTVVDLGYAPGSWSQVAFNLTKPRGRVVGVDIIPAQPPRGVSTIQGNFLSPRVQEYVKDFVRDPHRGRPRSQLSTFTDQEETAPNPDPENDEGYIDLERSSSAHINKEERGEESNQPLRNARVGSVDVVLSDMLMNTSGTKSRDHLGSMELCKAALDFASVVLKQGGHFVCKYYQGSGEKEFENELKRLFYRVYREKPDSSRSESKEAYFIGIRRRIEKDKED
ncbi:21S rRNA (uridine(2791)-2'-O)-methyltransferase MRM2 [Microsporum canis CBS 113480]|uniref:rRNA methyltransferase 2, mitochondrial n=1 Tax=Arthroderma otae (strain ATCC MYA-4605 / CBS 113480) TaxID=554155 RepID=C5FFA6_ARTOC|nr:21S rRNA (uridine(2791)-2'-O)-methyltransferase MRM2 [Microsporum canis CBS 113480]EEQ28490.1 ribosomal RNA methyltransferase MRM2 [Microsporum canis CBS 113480]